MNETDQLMRIKTIIGTLIGVIIIVCTFFVFQPSASAGGQVKESVESSCREKAKDSKMIWEKLPHQFFSSI
jgi:hypothetical protein